MERLRNANPLLAAAGLVCLLVLVAPGAALADDEHEVTVKMEFVDAPACNDATIVIAAASCDGNEIAAELMSEMSARGLLIATCGYASGDDEWQCAYLEPDGCDQVDIEVAVELGTDCPTDEARIRYGGPWGGVWEFAYDFD